MSDSVRPHRWQPTRLRHPWDSHSPGKNTCTGDAQISEKFGNGCYDFQTIWANFVPCSVWQNVWTDSPKLSLQETFELLPLLWKSHALKSLLVLGELLTYGAETIHPWVCGGNQPESTEKLVNHPDTQAMCTYYHYKIGFLAVCYAATLWPS